MMEPEPRPLEIVTTKRLINELVRRSPKGIIIVRNRNDNRDADWSFHTNHNAPVAENFKLLNIATKIVQDTIG